MKKLIWCEIWFHDKIFASNVPELVAKFSCLGDAMIFFNQFYPRYADRDCSVTLIRGKTILTQREFEVPTTEKE